MNDPTGEMPVTPSADVSTSTEVETITTFNRYQDLASITSNFRDEGVGTPEHLCMVALGLVGESQELVDAFEEGEGDVATKKEIGDVAWYVAEGGRAIGMSLTTLGNGYVDDEDGTIYEGGPEDLEQLRRLMLKNGETSGDASWEFARLALKHAAKIGEHVKKVKFHGKPIDAALISGHLREIMDSLATLCALNDFSMREILTMNISKLKQRHAHKYDTAYGQRVMGRA